MHVLLLHGVDCPRCRRPWAWHEPDCVDVAHKPDPNQLRLIEGAQEGERVWAGWDAGADQHE